MRRIIGLSYGTSWDYLTRNCLDIFIMWISSRCCSQPYRNFAAIIAIFCSVLPHGYCLKEETHVLSSTVQVDTDHHFPLVLIADEPFDVVFNYTVLSHYNGTVLQDGFDDSIVIRAVVNKENIVEINGNSEFSIHAQRSNGNFSVQLEGKLPGRATFSFSLNQEGNKASRKYSLQTDILDESSSCMLDYSSKYQCKYEVTVERKERAIDIIFNVVIILLVVIANVGMGCKVDLGVVKSELRRPVAPIIGLLSQFLFMPLVAFAIVYSLNLDPGLALGFFALGCAPGGSASNAYTHLLNGSVSLSVTMTLISTLAALGFIPLWLFSLGRLVYDEGGIEIPFENIIFSLLGIIIPVVVGLVIQRKCPRLSERLIKSVKYVIAVFIVFILTVGVYANLYIFYMLSGEVLLIAAALPYLGFIFGGLISLLLRQEKSNIIAIAVETGIQNTGIPIILLRLSLSGPDKDTGIVAPVASALFTPIPLVIWIIYIQVQARRRKKLADRLQENVDLYENDSPQQKESQESFIDD